jgi:para-nitrobenzyl esterase
MRRRPFLLLAFLCAGGAARPQEAPPPAPAGPDPLELPLESGTVKGAWAGAESEGLRVFRGIPYAAPPVGERRFQPPAPVARWEGTRACVKPGPSCLQPRRGDLPERPVGEMSEDCLYLNVWAPVPKGGQRLPVLVWIHGGGFFLGSGSFPLYDGAALARQGVVVLTINYRLGPFGFFVHPALAKGSPDGTSGNYGLMDQVAALRWVRSNISTFGGDPGNVTIFGESAGGASVCWLLATPSARGLFHRAISESGTPGAGLRSGESYEEACRRVSERLGCEGKEDVAAALRAVPAAELLEKSRPGLRGQEGVTIFSPVADGKFVPDEPLKAVESGKGAVVPVMIGANAADGSVFAAVLPVRKVLGYELLLRTLFGGDAPDVAAMFPAKKDDEVEGALTDVLTMSAFVAPARAWARALAQDPNRTVWLYHFAGIPRVRAGRQGARHGAEIPYVFGTLRGLATEQDRALAATMSGAWVRFARTGDPNGEGLPRWRPHDAIGDAWFEFGRDVQPATKLHKDACDLFDRIRAGRQR